MFEKIIKSAFAPKGPVCGHVGPGEEDSKVTLGRKKDSSYTQCFSKIQLPNGTRADVYVDNSGQTDQNACTQVMHEFFKLSIKAYESKYNSSAYPKASVYHFQNSSLYLLGEYEELKRHYSLVPCFVEVDKNQVATPAFIPGSDQKCLEIIRFLKASNSHS